MTTAITASVFLIVIGIVGMVAWLAGSALTIFATDDRKDHLPVVLIGLWLAVLIMAILTTIFGATIYGALTHPAS